MKQKLDITTWNRKEHYLFFSQMEEPFFGITTTIDCSIAYLKAKELQIPFFTYYLHKTLAAVNSFECFRYRIIDNEINASATIMRADNTFGFSLIEFSDDIVLFSENVLKETDRVRQTSGLFTRDFNDNLIHFSTTPWINFTALSHARSFTFPDSCPKITIGKITDDNGKKTFPLSVNAHHGLMDGFHVGQFVNLFQELMNQ